MLSSFTVALLLLGQAAPGAAPSSGADLEALRQEYAVVRANLAPHYDGFFLDDDEHAPGWLDRLWVLTAAWTARQLDLHPQATRAEVAEWLRALDPQLEVEAQDLHGAWLVAFSRGESGSVFLVVQDAGSHRGDRGHRVAWFMKDAQPHWSAAADRESCQDRNAAGGDEPCGGWLPSIGRLPADAGGHPRFYVDAETAQRAGITVGGELTLWTWDGRQAVLGGVKAYAFSIEAEGRARLAGDAVVLRSKEAFRTLLSDGPSPARRVETRFVIQPYGFAGGRSVSLDPQLDAVDELLVRLQRHEETRDLAAPAAARTVARAVADWDQEPDEQGLRSGLLMSALPSEQPGPWLCVAIDGLGSFAFQFQTRGERLYIVRARPERCSG